MTALCGVAALLFTVSIGTPAQAWTFSAWTTVYNGADMCVQGEAGIDHVRPGLLSGNLAYAGTLALTPGCGRGLANRFAAIRLDVFRWNGATWQVCRSTDWTYGTTSVDQWGPTGPSQAFDYGGAVCGSGFYGTMAYPFVWDGTQWRGGAVWSGTEQLP
jgi:hypothetical protein